MASEDQALPVAEPVPEPVPEPAQESTLEELPVLAVRDTVIFPGALLPLTVGRPASIALVQSLGENRLLAVVSQLDPSEENPDPSGSVSDGHRLRDAQSAARAQGQSAAVLRGHRAHSHPRVHRYRSVSARARGTHRRDGAGHDPGDGGAAAERGEPVPADCDGVAESFGRSGFYRASHITEPGRLADFIAGNLPTLGHAERQQLLEHLDPGSRLEEMLRHLTRELELVELRGRIQSEVQGQLSQSQRQFYLREQLKAIQKELGEGDETQRDIEELREKLEAAGMTDEVKTEAMRELNRLSRMATASPEYGVTRTYLEWMAGLPWSTSIGLAGGREARRRDSGRRPLRPGKGEGPHSRLPGRAAIAAACSKGPILCFVGPPGVGKTSLGPLHRARAGAQIRAHLDGRHAR